jgi:hypothetical protein
MLNVAVYALTTVLIIIRLAFTLRDETFERARFAVVGQRLIIERGGERCLYCVAAFNFIGYLAACNALKTVTCIPAPKHTSHHF